MEIEIEPIREGTISLSLRMIREISLVSAASLFSFLANAIAGLFIARTLLPMEYGRVAYFLSIFMFGTLLAGFGLTTKVTSDLSGALDSKGDLNKRFYTLLVARILTAMPLLVMGLILTRFFKDHLYFYAGVVAVFFMLSDFLIGSLQGLQKTASVAALILIQPGVYLGLLFLGAVQRAEWILAALAASFVLSALVASFGIMQSRFLVRPYKEVLSLQYARRSLIPAIQIHGISLLQVTYVTYTIMLLGATAHFSQTAQLSIPLTIVRILPLTLTPVLSTILYPRLCTLCARKDIQSAAHALDFFYKVLAVGALCLVSLLAAYSDLAIRLLYTSKYLSSALLLSLLSPLTFLLLIESQMTLALIAAGATRPILVALAWRLSLLIVGATGLLALHLSDQTILLAGVYDVSAMVGLAIEWWQLDVVFAYSPPVRRTLVVGAGALIIAFSLRQFLPNLSNVLESDGYRAILAGLLTIGLAGWLLLGSEIRALQLTIQRYLARTTP